MGEKLKFFEAMKKLCYVRSVNLDKKRELCERVVVSTVTYEVKALGM